MDIEGKIIQFLGETGGTSKAGNPWKKKEWILETYGNYPKKVKVQVMGNRADTIDLQVGQDYVLSVDIESREYNERWYTDVNIFRAQPKSEMMGQSQNFNGMPGSYPTPGNYQEAVPNQGPNQFPPFDGGAGFDAGGGFTQSEDQDDELPF